MNIDAQEIKRLRRLWESYAGGKHWNDNQEALKEMAIRFFDLLEALERQQAVIEAAEQVDEIGDDYLSPGHPLFDALLKLHDALAALKTS